MDPSTDNNNGAQSRLCLLAHNARNVTEGHGTIRYLLLVFSGLE